MDEEKEVVTKKNRIRPKTKSLRKILRDKIECALLHKTSPILNLFSKTSDSEMSAPLTKVLSALDVADIANKLSNAQFRTISKITRVFSIVGPDDGPLLILFDQRNRDDLDEKTVYVDNIPPSCSAAQLQRRAAVFGTVVHVHLPNVLALKRQSCLGTEKPLHSGFGFIQFSSKLAVRRICRRYAPNCHLNRAHHPRKNKKKNVTLNSTAPEQSQEPMDFVPADPSNSGSTKRIRRSTEISVSGVEDSGTESEVQHNQNDETKRKKRTRKRKHRIPVAFRLTKFLEKLQVFPFEKYKSLKNEYLQMKKDSLGHLKVALTNAGQYALPNQPRQNASPDAPPVRKKPRRRTRSSAKASNTPRKHKRPHRSRTKLLRVAHYLKSTVFSARPDENDENIPANSDV